MISDNAMKKIRRLCDAGDDFLDRGDFSGALEKYQLAANLIPEPKEQFDEAMNVYTAIGEALFFDCNYAQALGAFKIASKSPGGIENPLTHLRLGQVYYELGDLEKAADELTRGYMLDGAKLFEGEDEKYFAFLRDRIIT